MDVIFEKVHFWKMVFESFYWRPSNYVDRAMSSGLDVECFSLSSQPPRTAASQLPEQDSLALPSWQRDEKALNEKITIKKFPDSDDHAGCTQGPLSTSDHPICQFLTGSLAGSFSLGVSRKFSARKFSKRKFPIETFNRFGNLHLPFNRQAKIIKNFEALNLNAGSDCRTRPFLVG